MLPFELLPIPAGGAEAELGRSRPGVTSVLVGDGDIFYAEWSEFVDEFQDPHEIVADAETLDIDAWFAAHGAGTRRAAGRMKTAMTLFDRLFRMLMLPVDFLLVPVRLVRWVREGKRPGFLTPSPFSSREGDPLPEAAGPRPDGKEYPDPVRYVLPKDSPGEIAAALIEVEEPWQAMAWLQHGSYAQSAPMAAHVGHARVLWERYGARIVTASSDHLGFELERPVTATADARAVMDRFFTLGADEINAEHRGSTGESLIGAKRWWVWWD